MKFALTSGLLLAVSVAFAKPLGERSIEARQPASITSASSATPTTSGSPVTQISDGQVQAPTSSRSGTASNAGAIETACAIVSAASASYLSAYPSATIARVNSSDAVACLNSIPIVPEYATELLAGLRTYLEFESDLEYLKDPPAGYVNPGKKISPVVIFVLTFVQAMICLGLSMLFRQQ